MNETRGETSRRHRRKREDKINKQQRMDPWQGAHWSVVPLRPGMSIFVRTPSKLLLRRTIFMKRPSDESIRPSVGFSEIRKRPLYKDRGVSFAFRFIQFIEQERLKANNVGTRLFGPVWIVSRSVQRLQQRVDVADGSVDRVHTGHLLTFATLLERQGVS